MVYACNLERQKHITCIVTTFLCLEMQYFASNANFVSRQVSCTLEPSQKLKNYRQTTENRGGVYSSGGQFRATLYDCCAMSFRKRLCREFIVSPCLFYLTIFGQHLQTQAHQCKKYIHQKTFFCHKNIDSKLTRPRRSSQYFKAVPQLFHLPLRLNTVGVYPDLKGYVQHILVYYSLKRFPRF